MKVLHIIDTLAMGGAENLLSELAGRQISLGYDVVVSPLVGGDYTPIREKMAEYGVPVHPFYDKGSVYNPFLIFKIIKKIRDFDIVHVHLFPALYWAGFAKILSLSQVPFIYTEHSTNNRRRNKKLLQVLDRFIYQKYNKIIACSERAMINYREAYPSIDHICYINNGVNVGIYKTAEPYSKKELLGVDDNVFIVTMVARFLPMKRQDIIVRAIALLPDSIHAVFVGGDPHDEGVAKVKVIRDALHVTNRVHFLYTRKDVPRILKTSDVILMASNYEGLSLSSIEGMAAGKPLVATNVDGLREVVNGAGVLFENEDSQGLSDIIRKLYSDKQYYDIVSKKSQKRAERYDINKMVESYLREYDNVVKIHNGKSLEC